MSILRTVLIVAPLALSTPALAAHNRFSDSEFLAAARCQALLASTDLAGHKDTHAIDALMTKEGAYRELPIVNLAKSRYSTAAREVRDASGQGRDNLVAERDGPVCKELFAPGPLNPAIQPSY